MRRVGGRVRAERRGTEADMTVGKICQHQVDFADPEEPVRAAAQRMAARNVGTLVVVDELRRPVGLLTDRDIALTVVAAGLDPQLFCVRDVMTPHPHCISASVPIEKALTHMRELVVRRLPVIDADGAVTGIVSVDDILQVLAKEFGELGRLLERSSPRALASRP